MTSTKEIKNHISSVQDTRKITNAMYLIASTKMRRAKEELDQTRPYFDAIRAEIRRIFRTVEKIENQYFFPHNDEREIPGNYGFLVITADKGLAGAYNQNVIREALRRLGEHDNNKLFVVGEYGRQYFDAHQIPIEKSFLYTAQNPTIHRAREISSYLLEQYQQGELVKIYVIYTDFNSSMDVKAISTRLLPFHQAQFTDTGLEVGTHTSFEFVPSVETVLDNIVPSYVTGFIYSALVDSFCAEQNARMTAMDSANKNAQELLDQLSVEFNHVRQSAITQEITEISSGARGQQRTKGGTRP